MAVGDEQVTIYSGEDVEIPFLIPDQDITGWAMACYIRHPHTNTLLLTLTTTGGGIELTDPAAAGGGTGNVLLTSAQTQALDAWLCYEADLWRTDPGSNHLYVAWELEVRPSARYGRALAWHNPT